MNFHYTLSVATDKLISDIKNEQTKRVFNFAAGLDILPTEVFEIAVYIMCFNEYNFKMV